MRVHDDGLLWTRAAGVKAMPHLSAETVRQLAAAAGIRPEEQSLEDLARGLEAALGALERCEELDLGAHEPACTFQLRGGAADAEL